MSGPPLLALTAAFWFGLAGVFLKRGLQHVSPFTAALVSVVFTAGVVWSVAGLTAPLGLLATWRVLPFVVAGAVAPGPARLVLYYGIDRVGVSRGSALVATAPLFAVLMAAGMLGERPGPLLLLGAAGVVAGGALLAYRGHEEKVWRRRDLAFPVLAALGFALRDNVSRWGLRDFPEPMVAAAVATATSVGVMWLAAGARRMEGVGFTRVGLIFVMLSGLCDGAAYLTMWRALATGEVSIVSPLVHAQPFFTMMLAALFLRDLERVTWRIALASTFIVGGVAVILRGG